MQNMKYKTENIKHGIQIHQLGATSGVIDTWFAFTKI